MPTQRSAVVTFAVTLIMAGTLSTTPVQANDWKSYANHDSANNFMVRKTGRTWRAMSDDSRYTRCFKGRSNGRHGVQRYIEGRSWYSRARYGTTTWYSSRAWLDFLPRINSNGATIAIWLLKPDGTWGKQTHRRFHGTQSPAKVGLNYVWSHGCGKAREMEKS